MSRRISQLINEPERDVAKLISELETKNGYPSHDSRHLAENVQKVRLKIIDLGLDPNDTTAKELFHALNARFEKDSQQFEQYFGTSEGGFDKVSATAVKLVNSYADLPLQWAIKTKAAKQALRANPPKKVMSYLGYRSVESMLKRCNIYEAFLACQVLESKLWHKNLAKYASKLDQTEFEMRLLKTMVLSEDVWSDVTKPDELGVYDSLIGAAGLWPSEILNSTPLLTHLLLLLESFTPEVKLKPGLQLVKMNMVVWWADMDHLIAELDGQHVSFNLKDCALNAWYQNRYEDRILDSGRKSFWTELVNRYRDHTAEEPLFDNQAAEKLANLHLGVPEPAFEFAEEFDG